MSNNTIVRGLLVPSLKNKPLDGRQDVPTLADIVNIENPYVNFIFPVEETGKWYKVLSLTDKVIDELVIPNGMIDEYEEFGGGMTDTQKQEYLTKSLAEQMYLKKEDAVNEYLNKTEAEADYLKKKNAEEFYQPKGNYQPSGDYATKQELEDLENRISQGGGSGGGGGASFIDAPSDGKIYGRKDGFWEELKDAPSDGKAYARLNGKWVAIESGNALDPMLPVLSLNINSTKENDLTIDKVLAIVTYADKEFALGNGGKMNVPYGLDVTIKFQNVDNYTTPETVVFENVQSDISAEATYIYLPEVLNVYVSADDSSLVDGQIVEAEISSSNIHLKNGLYIEDIDGYLYKKEEWDDNKTLNSIIIISEALKLRTYPQSSVYDFVVDDTNSNELDEALNDYDGVANTHGTGGRIPFTTAITYTWANGNVGGYVPALGELMEIYKYWDEYINFVNKQSIGVSLEYIGSSSGSTKESARNSPRHYIWGVDTNTGEVSDRESGAYLVVQKITDEDVLKTRKKESKEVLGGMASFDLLIGDEVILRINEKEGKYSKPEDVSFAIKKGGNNVSFVYKKLTIDTIYINNLIADTDSIISGEINGAAVQAIWNDVHRYLGKIVKKEDSTEELVLLDIDQNDNRLYTDGSLIDLESLGTTAYFFTKIPSMAYKITQMSDNIYKVEISYKHKPNGEGWNYFDELIVPTFPSDYSSGLGIYRGNASAKYEISDYNKYIDGISVYDYSTLVLLVMAKYGIIQENYNIESIQGIGTFIDSNNTENNNILNGFSLLTGTKDAKRIIAENVEVYNILGIENLLKFRRTVEAYQYDSSNVVGFFQRDGVSIALNVTNSVISVLSRDGKTRDRYSVDAYSNILWIKSLIIEDLFVAYGKTYGGSQDTYFKEYQFANDLTNHSARYPYLANLFRVYFGGMSQVSYSSRVKVLCPYRLEQNSDAFNALTNIWK